MNITISRTALFQAIQACQSIVEKRHSIPILANLLLEASENTLSITATDLEVGLRTQSTALIEEAGTITVSAHKLIEIVKEFDSEHDVILKTSDNFMSICSGRSRFRLTTLPADEYPNITEESTETVIMLKGSSLCEMISATKFAMSTDETRKYLTGTLFEIDDDQVLRLVTTDGHRLALSETPLEDNIKSISCIVPKKAVLELNKLCDAHDVQVELSINECQLRAKIGSTVFVTKLINAKFPVYQDVIPVDNPHRIVIERTVFDQVLRRNMIVANEFTHDIRLVFSESGIDVSAHNTEQEEAEEHLVVEYSGPECAIGFNGKYLRDVLGAIRSSSVCIDLRDELSPLLISGSDSQQSRYVVMPMRI
ncbi:MAG: DNA polymerase III subunit beta [Mariprofundaceae bacterium]|nr:DNA polymerase III subunit beta [Mariprofundaceae bacterium]